MLERFERTGRTAARRRAGGTPPRRPSSSHSPLPITLFLLFLLCVLAQSAPAQWGAASKVVTATARFEPAEAARGAEIELMVTADVDSRYHLYGMNQPPGDGPGPAATELNLAEDNPAILEERGPWVEPEPTRKFDKGFERDVTILEGSPLVFKRRFAVKRDEAPGVYTIKGSIYAQACTEISCLPPADFAFTATLTVTEGEPVEAAPTPAVSTTIATASKPPPSATTGGTAEAIASRGFGSFLLYAFLFGIFALATPCVFPMIPITISFFTNKAAKSTMQAAKIAGVYVLSIILGFTLIGFGFSLVLLMLGAGVASSGFANLIASNPWVNLFFALLYGAFALSLFEVFEIRMPDVIARRVNAGAAGRTDLFGIAMKALVFVVISFTCTAPLLGVLIVQALGGEWTRPLFGMMAFATGFAAPFFILALAPQLVGNLPKAGAWLYATKVVMGLVVIAAAFKFLSNADIVWNTHNMVLTREALLAVWAAISLVIALYLFRIIRFGEDSGERRVGFARLGLGMASLALALYLGAGLFGGRVHGWVDAYLPPDLSGKEAATTTGGGLAASRTMTGGTEVSAGFSWFEDIDAAREHARKLGKNIFIDFTGYTCTNCRLMEKNMFPRPEIAPLLEKYVRVKLVTDDRQVGKKWQNYQATMFGTVALPFYAIITPEDVVLGKAEYTTDAAQFAVFLGRGLVGG